MKTNKIIALISDIIITLTYIVGGIVVIVLNHHSLESDAKLLGIVIIICATLKLIKFIVNQEYKEGHLLGLGSGIIGLSFGFIFLFSTLDIVHICLLWGLYEIAFGTIDIVESLKDRRIAPIEIWTGLISVSEIIFGTLLCIHASRGINEHLIYIGITLILTSLGCLARMIYRYIIEPKKEKKQQNQTDA